MLKVSGEELVFQQLVRDFFAVAQRALTRGRVLTRTSHTSEELLHKREQRIELSWRQLTQANLPAVMQKELVIFRNGT